MSQKTYETEWDEVKTPKSRNFSSLGLMFAVNSKTGEKDLIGRVFISPWLIKDNWMFHVRLGLERGNDTITRNLPYSEGYETAKNRAEELLKTYSQLLFGDN